MENFFIVTVIIFLVLLAVMTGMVIAWKNAYDRLNALFSVKTIIIIILLLLGFTDNRADMYINIALSYSILSFVSSILLAKYIGGGKKND